MPGGAPRVYKRPRSQPPGSQPTQFHLLTGWLAQPRWSPCSEHPGRFHLAPWPDTDAVGARAGAGAAAGDADAADEGGDVVGGGEGEVKGPAPWAWGAGGEGPRCAETPPPPVPAPSVLPPLHHGEVQEKMNAQKSPVHRTPACNATSRQDPPASS